MGRIGRDDLTSDEPVEQHPYRGEVLLDRRLLEILGQRLDIGGDMQRLDIGDFADGVLVAPGEEPRGGAIIGHAGVLVPDRRGGYAAALCFLMNRALGRTPSLRG